jgi:AhpD family alkylhydroperoxidase
MSASSFVQHTVESAPAASRRLMEGTARRLGYLPSAVGRIAASPQLLDGFLKVNGLFETTKLDPLAREVVAMTIGARNGCHICVAMHTAGLVAMGASPQLLAALRNQEPIEDGRLEAVRVFTLEVLATAGAVGTAPMNAFLAQGFTVQNALEVVLGIGTYTMSTLANRLTEAPLDEQLEPFAWTSDSAV